VHEAQGLWTGGRRRRGQLDTIVDADGNVAAADDGAVNPHARGREPLLEAATRGSEVERLQPLVELHGCNSSSRWSSDRDGHSSFSLLPIRPTPRG